MRAPAAHSRPAGTRGYDGPAAGGAGTRNGALLRLAGTAGFEAFITIDKGIEFQQRVAALPFGVVALRAPSNDVDDLRPLMPAVLAALPTLRTGQLVRVPS